jgi:hypothetical protein
LLALPEASQVFLSLQSEFLAAACSDDFIAGKKYIYHPQLENRIYLSMRFEL